MPAPVLPLTTQISQTSSKTRSNRVLVAQFGQGFAQFVKDGPNSQFDKWTVNWNHLNSTDRGTLTTFYETVGSDTWWTLQPPGDATSKKWRIDKDTYKDTPESGNLYSISFNCTQYFDLGLG